MSNAQFRVPDPINEPVLGYAPGAPERTRLEAELQRMAGERIDIPIVVVKSNPETPSSREAS